MTRPPAVASVSSSCGPGRCVPRYMSAGAAGMDLASAADGPHRASRRARGSACRRGWPSKFRRASRGRCGRGRGWRRKLGVTVLNAPGTIDSDYRGEIVVLLVNLGTETYTIAPGDRVAQLVIAPVTRCVLEEAVELGESGRGDGGFGHTG